jgi:diguanylate cyclase (GGDEF)-like protein
VPLQRGGHVSGLIALFDPVLAGRFVKRDADELQTLARQAAIAVENVQLHAEAKRASITDPLTGQWNVRYLSMTLNQEVERASRFERPLAVLMLDLDHFKRVNDTYGHAKGDEVLRELARRVRSQIREVDTFARYGGEEFVLVLPETDLDGARRLAERIVTAVRRTPFGADGDQPIDVTVSMGAAVFPSHGSTATYLLRAADQALYDAKRGGRDRVVVAQEGSLSSPR